MDVLFDESCPNWHKDPEYNKFFLNAQQNHFNQKLHACGFVLLNEVFEALGLPRTTQGATVGWTKDTVVYFGLAEVESWEGAIALKFNVEGVVYDKIDAINEGQR